MNKGTAAPASRGSVGAPRTAGGRKAGPTCPIVRGSSLGIAPERSGSPKRISEQRKIVRGVRHEQRNRRAGVARIGRCAPNGRRAKSRPYVPDSSGLLARHRAGAERESKENFRTEKDRKRSSS